MICHKYKCAFVHIPKTAGCSIEYALSGKSERKHISLEKINSLVKDYYIFSVVRNPLDRLVSMFFYLKKLEETPYKSKMTFSDFIKEGSNWWKSNYSIRYRDYEDNFDWEQYKKTFYFTPQTTWIKRDGKIAVDAIIKFENLEIEFYQVCKKLNIATTLEHLNYTEHQHYGYYYDEELIDICKKWFEDDFAEFYS